MWLIVLDVCAVSIQQIVWSHAQLKPFLSSIPCWNYYLAFGTTSVILFFRFSTSILWQTSGKGFIILSELYTVWVNILIYNPAFSWISSKLHNDCIASMSFQKTAKQYSTDPRFAENFTFQWTWVELKTVKRKIYPCVSVHWTGHSLPNFKC